MSPRTPAESEKDEQKKTNNGKDKRRAAGGSGQTKTENVHPHVGLGSR